MKPLKERYQDVNKNEIKFLGKVWADIEYDRYDGRRRLFRITRSNYGEKRQDSENCARRPKTQRQLRKEKATHAKYGRTIKPNIHRTIQEQPRSNLDICSRP